MSGSDPTYATNVAAISMPRIITTASYTAVPLPGIMDNGSTADLVVYSINANGTLGDKYAATAYSVTAATGTMTSSTITITPATGDTKWIIKYNRSVTENGIKIQNRSDTFPSTVKLTLKVLIVDPCQPDTVCAAYVVLPSFQPSAEITVGFSTDSTIDFTGKLQTSYCGTDKVLYEIFVCSDDEEESA